MEKRLLLEGLFFFFFPFLGCMCVERGGFGRKEGEIRRDFERGMRTV